MNNHIIRTETNQRENNEDSFLLFSLLPAATVLAVADGMGGHAHGEDVSREALRKIGLALFELLTLEPALNQIAPTAEFPPQRLAEVMWNAVQQTNHHLRRMIETNKWDKAGSTLVVAIVTNQQVIVANLGDSPLFHYQTATGQLVKITQDHTVTGALLRANLISTDMARHHEGRSRLEYFLGCDRLPHGPQAWAVTLAPGDLLLLCSDGISGRLSTDAIQQILAQPHGNLATIADQLLQLAVAAGETDNQTLILWRHQPLSPAARAALPTLATHTLDPANLPTLIWPNSPGEND